MDQVHAYLCMASHFAEHPIITTNIDSDVHLKLKIAWLIFNNHIVTPFIDDKDESSPCHVTTSSSKVALGFQHCNLPPPHATAWKRGEWDRVLNQLNLSAEEETRTWVEIGVSGVIPWMLNGNICRCCYSSPIVGELCEKRITNGFSPWNDKVSVQNWEQSICIPFYDTRHLRCFIFIASSFLPWI